jgi:hypothetical protein
VAGSSLRRRARGKSLIATVCFIVNRDGSFCLVWFGCGFRLGRGSCYNPKILERSIKAPRGPPVRTPAPSVIIHIPFLFPHRFYFYLASAKNHSIPPGATSLDYLGPLGMSGKTRPPSPSPSPSPVPVPRPLGPPGRFPCRSR